MGNYENSVSYHQNRHFSSGAIIRLVASVCVSVRLSVGALLFEPFDLDFWREGRP